MRGETLIRKRTLLLIGIFLVLAWAGNAATLTFDQFGYEYDDNVNFSTLLSQMFSVPLADVVRSFFSEPFFGFVNIAMLATAAAVVVVELRTAAHKHVPLGIIALLAAPLGLLALSAGALTVLAGRDGEWLGESWPVLDVFFFWSVALAAYAFAELTISRSTPS